jgi:hypothetical protein
VRATPFSRLFYTPKPFQVFATDVDRGRDSPMRLRKTALGGNVVISFLRRKKEIRKKMVSHGFELVRLSWATF